MGEIAVLLRRVCGGYRKRGNNGKLRGMRHYRESDEGGTGTHENEREIWRPLGEISWA
jgi:hypothetical protein